MAISIMMMEMMIKRHHIETDDGQTCGFIAIGVAIKVLLITFQDVELLESRNISKLVCEDHDKPQTNSVAGCSRMKPPIAGVFYQLVT